MKTKNAKILVPHGKEERRRVLVAKLGGKCSNEECPLPDRGAGLPDFCFDFHHRDPATKSFPMNKIHTRSWSAVLAEASKCDILCAVCHRLWHEGYPYGHQPADTVVLDNGERYVVNDLIAKHGIRHHTYRSRVRRGWDKVSAATTLPGSRRNPKQMMAKIDRTPKLTINGVTKPKKKWLAEYNVKRQTFEYRIKMGMSPEQAIVAPPAPGRKYDSIGFYRS